jgi:hypothetical protein
MNKKIKTADESLSEFGRRINELVAKYESRNPDCREIIKEFRKMLNEMYEIHKKINNNNN